MVKKIVIAADSFKGSISSADFAEVCTSVASEELNGCDVVSVTLGDGGEGTMDALIGAYAAKRQSLIVAGPLMQPVKASYAISSDGTTAIIEMAQAAGLTLIPADKRNPMATTTFGVGQMIADALARGCRKFIVGIGGSATNDCGTGMLQALGFRFYDAGGKELCGCGDNLDKIAKIDNSGVLTALKDSIFEIACDVDNPLYGKEGAAFVFAPQKGADNEMAEALDRGMRQFSVLIASLGYGDKSQMAGAGAAGGLGWAFATFLGGKLRSGIDLVLDACDFNNLISDASLIVTGEGRIDSQTLHGKTIAGVKKRADVAGKPVVVLAGAICDDEAVDKMGFVGVFSIQQKPVSLAEALDPPVARRNLAFTFRQILRLARFTFFS